MLHWAAIVGHLETCRLIMGNLQGKNPKDENGITPLLGAAWGERLKICRLILENLPEKNPANKIGETLDLAEAKGLANVCELIRQNL